jgi:hypothetical protein
LFIFLFNPSILMNPTLSDPAHFLCGTTSASHSFLCYCRNFTWHQPTTQIIRIDVAHPCTSCVEVVAHQVMTIHMTDRDRDWQKETVYALVPFTQVMAYFTCAYFLRSGNTTDKIRERLEEREKIIFSCRFCVSALHGYC